jgi:hypothetical protein
MVCVIGTGDIGEAPVAQLLQATIGPAAVVVGVGLALVLASGNMNIYVASLSAIGANLPCARGASGALTCLVD